MKVRIILQVVNEHGDVINHRGHPASCGADRVEASKTFAPRYKDINEARDSLNRIWAVASSIDEILSAKM